MKTIVGTIAIAWTVSTALSAQVPNFTPQTPLIAALVHNEVAEATRLLDDGADPNEGRFVGFPPVFLAIQRQALGLLRAMAATGRGPERARRFWVHCVDVGRVQRAR